MNKILELLEKKKEVGFVKDGIEAKVEKYAQAYREAADKAQEEMLKERTAPAELSEEERKEQSRITAIAIEECSKAYKTYLGQKKTYVLYEVAEEEAETAVLAAIAVLATIETSSEAEIDAHGEHERLEIAFKKAYEERKKIEKKYMDAASGEAREKAYEAYMIEDKVCLELSDAKMDANRTIRTAWRNRVAAHHANNIAWIAYTEASKEAKMMEGE